MKQSGAALAPTLFVYIIVVAVFFSFCKRKSERANELDAQKTHSHMYMHMLINDQHARLVLGKVYYYVRKH